MWITHPDHLTALHIPSGSLTSEITFTVAYTQSRSTAELQGMDHFFTITGTPFPEPAALLLGFKNPGGIIAETINLYHLESGTWMTRNITITEQSDNHLLAWINQPGVYGLLGETHHLYLPLVLRRR